MDDKNTVIPIELIERRIYMIRGQKVMLDSDLAELYGVENKQLTRQVRRNLNRFPESYMFQLSKDEFDNLRSQIGTSSWGGRRYPPYAFTEHGVVMLSSVLNSDRAILASRCVVDTFIRMRELLATHKDLADKINEHDSQIAYLFSMIEDLKIQPEPENYKLPAGFGSTDKKDKD